LDDDNHVALTYMGSPSSFNGLREDPLDPNSLLTSFNANPSTYNFSELIQNQDLTLRYTSKLLDKKLQIELMGGYHYEKYEVIPEKKPAPLTIDNRPGTLSDFEDFPACKTQVINGVSFNPCPVAGYRSGGFGFYNTLTDSRLVATGGITYFLEAGGTHAIKV